MQLITSIRLILSTERTQRRHAIRKSQRQVVGLFNTRFLGLIKIVKYEFYFLIVFNGLGVRSGPKCNIQYQCCGSGSVMDPYSGASWIRIRIRNTDPDLGPHMQIKDKIEAKDVRFNPYKRGMPAATK